MDPCFRDLKCNIHFYTSYKYKECSAFRLGLTMKAAVT